MKKYLSIFFKLAILSIALIGIQVAFVSCKSTKPVSTDYQVHEVHNTSHNQLDSVATSATADSHHFSSIVDSVLNFIHRSDTLLVKDSSVVVLDLQGNIVNQEHWHWRDKVSALVQNNTHAHSSADSSGVYKNETSVELHTDSASSDSVKTVDHHVVYEQKTPWQQFVSWVSEYYLFIILFSIAILYYIFIRK